MSDALTWMPAWEVHASSVKGEVSPVELCDHFLAGSPLDLRPAAV